MNKRSASQYFRGAEKYNCAQAIAKAFQTELNIPEEVIKAYANKGGGLAKDGMCGSVYAAQKLLKGPDDIAYLDQLFAEKSGSMGCKEILKLKKVSCSGTVDLAEEIIKKINGIP